MAVKNLPLNKGLLIEAGDNSMRYLFFKEKNEKNISVINDKCRHRGGPVRYSYKDENGRYRCPWHDNICIFQDVSKYVGFVYNNHTDIISVVLNNNSDSIDYLAKSVIPKLGTA